MNNRILSALAFLLAFSASAATRDISLVWGPSPTTNLGPISYTLHYGNAPRVYHRSTTGIWGTNATITVNTYQPWFFTVTATSGYGPESDFSNEVSVAGYDNPGRVVTVEIGAHDGARQLTNIVALTVTNPVGSAFFMGRIKGISLELMRETPTGWQVVTNYRVAMPTNAVPTVRIR